MSKIISLNEHRRRKRPVLKGANIENEQFAHTLEEVSQGLERTEHLLGDWMSRRKKLLRSRSRADIARDLAEFVARRQRRRQERDNNKAFTEALANALAERRSPNNTVPQFVDRSPTQQELEILNSLERLRKERKARHEK